MPHQHFSGVGGHEENPLIGPLFQHPLSSGDTVTLRHDDIQHEEVNAPLGLAQHVQCLGTALGFKDPVPFLAQNAVGYPSRYSFVIDDQNSGGWVGEWIRQSSLLLRGLWMDLATVIHFRQCLSQ